jgi:nucleotidyltransferase substrate binding protein (TIGR01987 family)
MSVRLDLTSLAAATQRLQEGLARYNFDESDDQIRDGLIQRFEFTYELAHKTLKRHLEATAPNPEDIDRLPFQDLIRTANVQGLLKGDWSDWKEYRELRSRTSHAYGERIALVVVAGIPKFLGEVTALLTNLEAANKGA